MWYTINRIYYVGLLPLSRPLQPVIYPAIEDLMTMCSVIRSSLYNVNMLTGEDMLDGIAAGTAAGVVGSHVARVTSPDDAVQLAQKDHLESIYLALAEIADFPDNTSYLLDASAPGNSQTIWVRYTNVAPNWAYGELLPKGDYPPGAAPITATTG